MKSRENCNSGEMELRREIRKPDQSLTRLECGTVNHAHEGGNLFLFLFSHLFSVVLALPVVCFLGLLILGLYLVCWLVGR